jgi:hypothetical protein
MIDTCQRAPTVDDMAKQAPTPDAPAPGDLPTFTTRLVRRNPAKLTRLAVNARYMRQEEYKRLVANVRRDGCLTSVPLIYAGEGDYPEGQELILSGNHRCDAARDAGLDDVDAMLIEERLDEGQLLAIQLSHNAIAGEDDPATLKQLYERIDDLDWRDYAGLDDKQLELLDQVSVEGLSEASIAYQTIQLVFLPHELREAERCLELARQFTDGGWLAAYKDYNATLDALASVHAAYNLGNIASVLGLILAVFERHLTDLQAGYIDPDDPTPKHKGRVGLEVVFGSRDVPVVEAAALTRAIRAAEKRGDIEAGQGWQLLARLADVYLAGLQ